LIVNSFLEAGRDAKWPVISMLCGSIVKVILGYLLIPNPNYGINGAPIGTVACYAVAFIVSSFILLIRRGYTLPIIKGCLVTYTSALISVNISKILYMRSQGSLNFVLSIILHILIAGLIYLILLVFSGLFGKDKENLMASFTKFREKNCQ
jgi:stage V sporulation protein B